MDSNLSKLLEEIRKNIIEQNWHNVSKLCENGIEKFPEFPFIHISLISAYIHLEEFDKARLLAEKAYESFPFNKTIKNLNSTLKEKSKFTETKKELSTIPEGDAPLESENEINRWEEKILCNSVFCFIQLPTSFKFKKLEL
ncbi:MAG: hypothetical protein N2517_08410 [Ignavibacteria bacterium]|nr:hypothetical protein [Ignavibacteria bacterium]